MNRLEFVALLENKAILDSIALLGYAIKVDKLKDFYNIEESVDYKKKRFNYLQLDTNDILIKAQYVVNLLKSDKFREYAKQTELCVYALKKVTIDDVLNLYVSDVFNYKINSINELIVYITLKDIHDYSNFKVLKNKELDIYYHLKKFNINFNKVQFNFVTTDNSEIIEVDNIVYTVSSANREAELLEKELIECFSTYKKLKYDDIVWLNEDDKKYTKSLIVKYENLILKLIDNTKNMPLNIRLETLKNKIDKLNRENDKIKNYIPF